METRRNIPHLKHHELFFISLLCQTVIGRYVPSRMLSASSISLTAMPLRTHVFKLVIDYGIVLQDPLNLPKLNLFEIRGDAWQIWTSSLTMMQTSLYVRLIRWHQCCEVWLFAQGFPSLILVLFWSAKGIMQTCMYFPLFPRSC